MKVVIYGCKGSIPLFTPGAKYGGNTSCMTVESGGQLLVIDAGSGLVFMQNEFRKKNSGSLGDLPPFHILLSHLHFDHICGLSVFEHTYRDAGMKIYTKKRSDLEIKEAIFGAFSPPYWPVDVGQCAKATCVEIKPDIPFIIGPFTITPFVAVHSDDTLSFRITDGKKTMVHLLDSETVDMSPKEQAILLKYCTDADLVVFDACYSTNDYTKHRGWGHSTVEEGVKRAKEWNCKKMIFSHFSQKYSDEELDSWTEFFEDERFILAHDGLELVI